MAISPVSDIVMDVVQAAEPRAAAAARAKLAAGPRAADGRNFSVGEAPPVPGAARIEATEQKPFQRFEAMVLQNFIESMLPKDAESAFGSGMAGDMWKSLMAEKLAGAMSQRGGIGIADHLLRDHYQVDGKQVPVGPASPLPAQKSAGEAMLPAALVEELQRRVVGTLTAAASENN